ncbi:class I tRNA ligase family protein, partial [Patescibacteria group bacterium]|nr:class I tRNA ligase family protein [Patescibacteria group bacterium]
MEYNFPKLEKKILKFWKRNKIFEKSISQRKKAKNFVFYDGPITVNARPGIHHVLARIFKDIVPRFKTMQGFRVERKNGWDTHGLPVELEVEKELGFKTKKDIEKYGIAKFNRACKKNVQKYIPLFKDFTEKVGYWVDMENSYITYENNYIETVWWIIKQIYRKGLLYKDYKVVPYCPRCGTSLSSHEVAQGYKRIREPAIYVKFKIQNSKFKNTYLLVWTTTPWTLPGNVAIAINPNFVYSKIKIDGQFLILAKKRIEDLGLKGEVVKDFKGENLLGIEYQPLFDFIRLEKRAHYIISGDFVSIDEGTGLVHIAPAFGEEDMEVSKKNDLPVILNVDEKGKFKPGVKNWASLFVKEADPKIIENLKKRNLLFRTEQYEHDYPFCWRCESPLLYYAKESWFINMQKVKKYLVKNNQKINWIPAHLKEGRFGEWLREVKDWALSRERYWGTPLPIWQCKKCGNLEVIGSKKDLISQKFSQNKYFILRHGKTTYQTGKKKTIYDWPGTSSFPLTKKGKKKIAKLTKKLKKKNIDLIYSSDALRTRQTANIVAKELGLKVNFDPRLRDINLGIYQRHKTEEFKRDFPVSLERFSKKPKKGENWTEVRKRIVSFIKDIDKKHEGKTILIVSHGDPLWLLDGATKGLKNQEFFKKTSKRHFIKTAKFRKIDFKDLPYDEKGNLDFHRPFIDKVKFLCPKCANLMERVSEVIDCWFDSGSMPFAQYHYPFENKKLIDKRKQFPADYIAEAVDQTRGWFYTLLAISTLLGFDSPYKNV